MGSEMCIRDRFYATGFSQFVVSLYNSGFTWGSEPLWRSRVVNLYPSLLRCPAKGRGFVLCLHAVRWPSLRGHSGSALHCGRAHHMSCSSLEPKRMDFWRCDMCVIAERVARRRRREASDMAVINSWQQRAAGAFDMGAARKRARFGGSATGH